MTFRYAPLALASPFWTVSSGTGTIVLNAASMSMLCHGVGTDAPLTTLLVWRSILSLLKLGIERKVSRRAFLSSGTTDLTSSEAPESLVSPIGRSLSDQALLVSSSIRTRTR